MPHCGATGLHMIEDGITSHEDVDRRITGANGVLSRVEPSGVLLPVLTCF